MSSSEQAPSGRAAVDRLGAARGEDGRERISEIQRARIVAAMVSVASERGVGYATIARVVARSGVSRRTFYELFEDREECFIAAFDEVIARASLYVLDAYDPSAKWAERIRTTIAALLTFLEAERGAGRLLVVETLGAGPRALEHRRRVLAQIVAVVDEGRLRGKGGDGLPPLTAEGIVGGALSLIHTRMVDDEGAALTGLLGPLVSMIVLPYLGQAAARRELERPAPASRNGHRKLATEDPLRGLGMRITYRTVRVLLAIGEHPGASNRQVGDHSGVRDQGQISKLLARLQELGLVSNTGDRTAKGEPNAWALTMRGEEIQAAISSGASYS